MKKMERIEQNMLMPFDVYQSRLSDEIVGIRQYDNGAEEPVAIHIEKQSIPALIDALKKFVE